MQKELCVTLKTIVPLYHYKGSAWVPAFAGAHAPGRAGQHFDLFDSIPLPHTTSVYAVGCEVMPRDRYRLAVGYLRLQFLA